MDIDEPGKVHMPVSLLLFFLSSGGKKRKAAGTDGTPKDALQNNLP